MFGVYVEAFTSSVGYGAESSTMQMTLVEDPDNGLTVKHSLDSGATFIAGFPEVGTVCQFQFEGFEFVGIFQRYNYSESTGGRKYDVTFESPSKILDGVQVILSGFEGTSFSGRYPFFPSEDLNITSQLNNIYNPFGVKENYAWGGSFGNSDYNQAGFPVPDDANRSGLAAKGLLTMIEEISQSKYTYDNPAGASTNTSVNSNSEELIGGPICYGDSKFVISFGNLKSLVPDFFRMPGTTKNINGILQECCELIVHDYVTIIDPVYSQVLTGYGTGTVPQPQYQSVFRNGVTPTEYDANGNVTGPVISFKYLDKSVQPQNGVVANLVNAARLNGTLISANNGQEYADVITQKMIIGDDATRVWEVGMQDLIPVYGQDMNGDWLLGAGFAATDIAPVALEGGGVYNAKVQELTAALSGFEVWSLYHDIGRAYGYSSMSSSVFGSIAMAGIAQMNKMLKDHTPGPAFMAGFSGDYHTKAIQEAATGKNGGKDAVKHIFDAVLNTAQNYYGKTYFAMLPVEPGGLANNLRYKNSFETESAWEISDAGWDPDFRMKNIEAYNNDGALKACAGYYPSQVTSTSSNKRDFSNISKTLIYDAPGAPDLIGTTDVKVDKKIYWRKNPYYQNNNNPYDDVSAMVHITLPRVFEYDEQATEKAALDSLFNSQVAQTHGLPANTPGFNPAQGGGVSSASSFESEFMTMKYMPTAVRPFKVSIPQKSTRYSWGPWYRFSTKIGKADLERDTKLKPETFGSMSALDEAAFSLTYAGTADLYASESGSVDLAEFPQYNIADRFDQNGPYVTKMDVSIGAGGITTKYQFSTWTRNFGKMAKYNIDRIAKANKERIAAAKRAADSGEGGGGGGGGGQKNSSTTGMQGGQKEVSSTDLNFFSGLGIPAGDPPVDANGNPVPITPANLGTSSWVMSMKSGSSLQHQYHRKVKIGHKVYTSYDVSFGCTPEQLFSPVGIKRDPDDVNAGILPYGNVVDAGENIDRVADTNSSFELGHASPTAGDLDPYFKFPKLDFGAVVMEDMAWLKDNNMHLSNSSNEINDKVTEVRTYGLRGPLLLSGWGYDVSGQPVPGKNDGEFFPVNPAKNRGSWKTGPVDLRWDEERQVWAGGLQFVEGVLRDAIGAASAVDAPDTNGVVTIYRKTEGPAPNPNDPRVASWAAAGNAGGYGTVRLTNRDPSLTAEVGAYVMAVRINQEWRVIYVGCATS
jgi:hypothetical protein